MSLVADGPLIQVCGRVEAGQAFGQGSDDLVAVDDAEVVVGQQRQHPAALADAGVKDDGAGLGDRHRAAGDDPVESLEVGYGEGQVVAVPLDLGADLR